MVRPLLALSVLSLSLASCKNEQTQPTSGSVTDEKKLASAKPESTASAPAASASAAGPPPPAPVCKVVAQKTWAKGANRTTGLTAEPLPDGRVALGLALGTTPHVLVVDKGGTGKLVKVAVKAGSALAKPPAAADGARHLMRVTPVKITGESAEAFVDYRDEYKNKRRRVACGPAESDDAWLVYDDTPWFERDEKDRTGDARAKAFKKKEADADEGHHELRDCRTFVDHKKNETWVVGSELVGKEQQPGGAIAWRTSLVVDKGAKMHELHTHDHELKDEKDAKIHKFEIPMSHPMHDGGFLLAARYSGTLVVALLNPDKTRRGDVHTYPGTPTLPDMAVDGDDTVLLTSFARGKNEFSLRAMRLSGKKPELPKTLSPVVLFPDDKDSETDPDFTRDDKGRRWITYVDGERGHGKLFIAPMDANFHAPGKPFEITQENEKASEARLVPLKDGTLLVAFLKEAEGGSYELVTEDLDCDIVK